MKEPKSQSIKIHETGLTLSRHDSAHIRRNHVGFYPKGPTVLKPNMLLTTCQVLKLFVYGLFNDTFNSRLYKVG